MSIDSEHPRQIPLIHLLMTTFLRLVALSCLYFGVRYWAMLIGYSDNGAGRFDFLSLPWKTAATALATLYPVAAVGLWLRSSWGPVIWVAIAATELSMHEIWTPIFGPNRLMSGMIVSIIVFYLFIRINLLLATRRARNRK